MPCLWREWTLRSLAYHTLIFLDRELSHTTRRLSNASQAAGGGLQSADSALSHLSSLLPSPEALRDLSLDGAFRILSEIFKRPVFATAMQLTLDALPEEIRSKVQQLWTASSSSDWVKYVKDDSYISALAVALTGLFLLRWARSDSKGSMPIRITLSGIRSAISLMRALISLTLSPAVFAYRLWRHRWVAAAMLALVVTSYETWFGTQTAGSLADSKPVAATPARL